MTLKINGPLRIDNLRHYPAETVIRLRCLLAAGVQARIDPHRKSFYDLEDGNRLFYIHVSPSGTVLLLATWVKEGISPAALRHESLTETAACCT